MKEDKLKIIIFLLSGIIIGLIIAFTIVFLLKGNDNNSDKNNEVETESIEYNDPLEYFENVNNSDNENTLKKGFTNVVDFLLYNKEIKGKTLSDLTDSAKLKIMKIALSLDKKIDDKFPNYKEKLSDKYKEIKSKVIELYVNTNNKVCTNHEQLCIDAKNEFNTLKDTFGLTLDYIKKYGIKGLDKLKEWYEDFRD